MQQHFLTINRSLSFKCPAFCLSGSQKCLEIDGPIYLTAKDSAVLFHFYRSQWKPPRFAYLIAN